MLYLLNKLAVSTNSIQFVTLGVAYKMQRLSKTLIITGRKHKKCRLSI